MQAFSRRRTGVGSGRQRSRVPLARRFTYRYMIAIAIFVTIAFASKHVTDESSARLNDLSQQIGAAVEQGSRVTAIDALANSLAFPTTTTSPGSADPKRESNASELQQKSLALQQTMQGLIKGDSSLNLPTVPVSSNLQALYNDEPDKLAQKVQTMSEAGQRLARLTGGADQDGVRTEAYTTIQSLKNEVLRGFEKAVNYYSDQIAAEVKAQNNNAQILLATSLGAAVLMVFMLFRPTARNIHVETSQLENAERIHRENNERQTFRNELSQALEVTDTEGEVLSAVGRAFMAVIPEKQIELLLTDSSHSHLRRAQVSLTHGEAGCPVDSPLGCAAIRRGQTVVYESSRMLNVCPKLPEHEDGVCSAVCVPVMFMGQALGVLHTVGPDGQPPNHTEIERLSVLASETGNRLGLMRNTQATELQASTDGLTGLLNRRSLESKARGLLLDAQPFSLAMADLDHFKLLNDTHGHEAGDRALRLFASVLRSGLRPEDMSARYGGEEFVILLPNTNIREAHAALARLQTSLSAELAKTSQPAFTASWGLTNNEGGDTFDEILAFADSMLYEAKRQGRDCIVVDRKAAEAAGMTAGQEDASGDHAGSDHSGSDHSGGDHSGSDGEGDLDDSAMGRFEKKVAVPKPAPAAPPNT